MKRYGAWQNWYLASLALTLAVLLVIQIFHARANDGYHVQQANIDNTDALTVLQCYTLFGTALMPEFDVFVKAIKGYIGLKNAGQLINDTLLTIIDFRLSANRKRMWVLDMKNKKVLYHCLVAHGRNTGDEYAVHFSNTPQSHQSSIGFYITGDIYQGKHGMSLYLDGIEKGFNDNARARYIVLHGADYVSEAFIQMHGRLGRSHGCPAIPRELENKIIPLIASRSCLFIYGSLPQYDIASELLRSPVDYSTLAFNAF